MRSCETQERPRILMIVDQIHVEAGKGVRTCMSTLSPNGKPLACSGDCVDESWFLRLDRHGILHFNSEPHDQ